MTSSQNGLHGLDVQTGSAATAMGTLTVNANQVFGINVNGSSMTLSQATVSATGNALGIQIATNANAFLADADSVINAVNNLATGLTIVSGARLVSFGGTINATGNPGVGVSVNSKAGLDLDAASTLNTSNNGDGLLVQQNSVMTVFNTPQFSGQRLALSAGRKPLDRVDLAVRLCRTPGCAVQHRQPGARPEIVRKESNLVEQDRLRFCVPVQPRQRVSQVVAKLGNLNRARCVLLQCLLQKRHSRGELIAIVANQSFDVLGHWYCRIDVAHEFRLGAGS